MKFQLKICLDMNFQQEIKKSFFSGYSIKQNLNVYICHITEKNKHRIVFCLFTCQPSVLDIVGTDFLMLLTAKSDAHSNFYIFEMEMLILDRQVVNLIFFYYMHKVPNMNDFTLYDCTMIKTDVFVSKRDRNQ